MSLEPERPDAWDIPSPKQHRSRNSMERILQAAEELLADKSFDQVTIDEIVERAQTSVGSFYHRFPNKEALLHALNRRDNEHGLRELVSLADPHHWQGACLADLIGTVVRSTLRLYRTRRNVLRAYYLRSLTDKEFAHGISAANDEVLKQLTLLVEQRRAEVAHPDPARAVRVGFLMVTRALHTHILFAEHATVPVELTDDELASELMCAWLGYMQYQGKRNQGDG